jgi:hypothetical protein
LDASSSTRLTLPVPLSNAVSGNYTVQQEVRSAEGLLLSNPTTSFMVLGLSGADQLSGSLDVLPAQIRSGGFAGCNSSNSQ